MTLVTYPAAFKTHLISVGFEVLPAAVIKIAISWDIVR
jgi:hypothetical protein